MKKLQGKLAGFFRMTPEKKSVAMDLIWMALVISGVMLLSYKANGMYPFGESFVARGDMVQQTVPAGMYYVWDMLHGKVSPFFTWESGFGMDLSGAVSLGAFLSPLNLLLYFSTRNALADFVNFFLILKMIGIAYAMYFYLRRYRVKNSVHVIGAVLYAFGASSLVLFPIMMTMDMAFLLPFIMMGVYRIFENRGCKLFLLMTAWSLIMNVYIAVITLLFLLFFCGANVLLCNRESRDKKRISLQLGVSVGIAGMLSAVVTIPALHCISISPRTEMTDILTTYLTALESNWSLSEWQTVESMLVNTALPLACIVYYMVCGKKPLSQKLSTYKASLFLMVILILSVCISGIELLWHGGSRAMWPVRFFYVISFVLVDFASAIYAGHQEIPEESDAREEEKTGEIEEKKGSRQKTFLQKGGICAASLLGAVASSLFFSDLYQDFCDKALYQKMGDGAMIIALEVFCFLVYLCILRKTRKRILWFFLCLELTAASIVSFAPNKDNGGYWAIENLTMCADVAENMQTKPAAFERIKNTDYALDMLDYSLMLGGESISNYWHIYNSTLQSNFAALGYSINWTQFLDTGGTVFTDTLFQNKYYLSRKKLSENLYDLCETIPGNDDTTLYVYQNKWELPFAIGTDVSGLEFSEDVFETQNDLFCAITGNTSPLLQDISGKIKSRKGKTTSGEGTTIQNNTLNIKVGSQKKILYFYHSGSDQVKIYVNGEMVTFPSSSSPEEVQYPADFSNGILCLGCYQNEYLQIVFQGTADVSDLHIAAADYDTFETAVQNIQKNNPTITSLTQKKSGLTLKMEDVTTENIFLPVSYDDGWVCRVNGKKVAVNSMDGMVSIPVQEGDVTISLRYVSPGRDVGLAVSLVALLLLAGYVALQKKGRIPAAENIPLLGEAAYLVFRIVFNVVFALYFVFPVLFRILKILINDLSL